MTVAKGLDVKLTSPIMCSNTSTIEGSRLVIVDFKITKTSIKFARWSLFEILPLLSVVLVLRISPTTKYSDAVD